MKYKPEKDHYRQICNLQGYFMRNGGFQVADTPKIMDRIGLERWCYEGEPTTEQVLKALQQIRKELQKGTMSSGKTNLIQKLIVFLKSWFAF